MELLDSLVEFLAEIFEIDTDKPNSVKTIHEFRIVKLSKIEVVHRILWRDMTKY